MNNEQYRRESSVFRLESKVTLVEEKITTCCGLTALAKERRLSERIDPEEYRRASRLSAEVIMEMIQLDSCTSPP